MICPACNAITEEDAEYCYNCGTRLSRRQTVPMPPPATPDWQRQAPQANWHQSAQSGWQDLQHEPVHLPPPPTPVPYAAPPTPPLHQAAAVPNSSLAIASLVAGVLAWIFPIVIIPAIVAVVCGHMARTEIRNAGGNLGGKGMATAGLVLGYMQLAFALLMFCSFLGLMVLGAAAS